MEMLLSLTRTHTHTSSARLLFVLTQLFFLPFPTVPSKLAQKRPVTSPAPPVPSPQLSLHHPSSVSPHSNHIVGSNHLPPSGGSGPPGAHGTPVGVVQPSPNSAGQNASSAGANSGNGRGSFAAALRNLAKQADVKDDEPGGGGGGGSAGGGGGGGVPDRSAPDGRGNQAVQMDRRQVDARDMNDQRGGSLQESRVRSAEAARGGDPKKRSSPQPPEKVRPLS